MPGYLGCCAGGEVRVSYSFMVKDLVPRMSSDFVTWVGMGGSWR